MIDYLRIAHALLEGPRQDAAVAEALAKLSDQPLHAADSWPSVGQDWLYPSFPSLSLAEASTHWPEAIALFDFACSDLAGGDIPIRFVEVDGVLRVSFPQMLGLDWPRKASAPVRHGLRAARWKPDPRVWIRSSFNVSTRPRREG